MYNVEKYIGECLDSIFAQTFEDYEIIVVDDCSTDKSREIVENYFPKFNGRLQLIKSEKNSGGCPGTPRNIGIRFSRGKYLMFVDADDAITSTALEEIYTAAENFSADVVHCQKFYRAAGESITTNKNFLQIVDTNVITQPIFMSDEISERIFDFVNEKIGAVPWNMLLRRNFIMQNNLTFPDFRSGEDLIFTFFILCKAKKILRVPNVFYVWRNNQNSFTWEKMPADKMIHRWTDSLFRGLKILDDFMANFEIFQKNPEYKYQVFELLIKNHTIRTFSLYAQIPAAKLDSLIRKELNEVDDKTALTAFLFGRMNSLNINFLRQNQIIQNQQAQIQQFANGMNSLAHNEQIKIFLREKFYNLIQKYSAIMPDEKFEQVKDYQIYYCWLQGEKNLPPIIQSCYNSLKMNAGDYKICFIDEKNFSDYIELPDYILKKFREGKIGPAHFSDIIRANLLEKFGGLWIDSTMLVTDPLEKHKNLLDQPFYSQKICQTKDMQNEYVRTSGFYVWYITYARWAVFLLGSSILHNPLFAFLKDFYNEYWKEFDGAVDYFLMDYMIDVAYDKIPFVKNEIDAVPINNPEVHKLVQHLNDPYKNFPYEQLLKENFFHKLTYKDPVNYNDKENVLNAIIQKYR